MERGTGSDAGLNGADVLRLSLIAITSVFVFEFFAGFLTNSLGLITDGAHALLDAAITGVLLIAARVALKPRDIEHTYGHGKVETIGGFIGGIALLVLSVIFIYQALVRITSGPFGSSVVNPGLIGFAAVAYALSADGFRLVILNRAVKQSKNNIILKSDLYHALTDLVSTAVALAGLWLVMIGFYQGDSIAAIALGCFLGYLSSKFAYRSAMELTDAIPPKLVSKVKESVHQTSGVLECKDVKMRRVGRESFIEVTVNLRANMSFENAHQISSEVEKNIARNIGGNPNITIHFEPIWSSDLPLESMIEKAALDTQGVRGVHNILVAKIDNREEVNVSLHIQVERSARLIEAHTIANTVEQSVKTRLKGVRHVTVHLEPLMPGVRALTPIMDKSIEERIKNMISRRQDIEEINKIVIYNTNEGVLKIDVNCIFRTPGKSIEQIHEQVSEVEKEIRMEYPSAIVTIHAEPE